MLPILRPGATLKINISGFNFSNPPVTVGGGKASSYLFSSTNSLTIGQSTQTAARIKSLLGSGVTSRCFRSFLQHILSTMLDPKKSAAIG